LVDSRLGFVTPGFGRSVGELGWHIVTALREIGGRAGIPVDGPGRETAVPLDAFTIAATHQRAAASIKMGVLEWDDSELTAIVDVYGEPWTKGRTLYVLIGHEVHHRGQMTVLLRLAGLPVPDTYGPAGPS